MSRELIWRGYTLLRAWQTTLPQVQLQLQLTSQTERPWPARRARKACAGPVLPRSM